MELKDKFDEMPKVYGIPFREMLSDSRIVVDRIMKSLREEYFTFRESMHETRITVSKIRREL